MINIGIVHYNTPRMTECLVMTINKYVKDCHIYIFDNSDNLPFTYQQDNLTRFDNTNGQYIDFEEWLEQFPKKGEEGSGKYISARHCISVDKLFDLIDDNFILMDSDVLLKQDISCFFDEDYIFCGEIGKTIFAPFIERLTPFLCFMTFGRENPPFQWWDESPIV